MPARKPNKEELVNLFLEILMTIKLYHWKTTSYAEHKATDELYASLNENFDQFVERMLGKDPKYKRLKMKGRTIKFVDPSTKKELIKIVKSFILVLQDKMNKYINVNKDTDLLNIRDEILGDLNQFLYLLSLK